MHAQRPCARKERPRQPIPKALPDDLFDYANDPAPRACYSRRGPSPRSFDVATLTAVDDWPQCVPVTEEELDIFKRYFGDVLDRLFGLIDEPERGLKLLSQSDNEKP
ncbi:hypothetical protein ACFFWD_31890 [Bradyrhizobium erythrophlei]|uniref:hypothetical protein n=1 Tax=Bradyrhizobium erythrophlei TaxID=1437360 RepID=UPI0035ECCCDC